MSEEQVLDQKNKMMRCLLKHMVLANNPQTKVLARIKKFFFFWLLRDPRHTHDIKFKAARDATTGQGPIEYLQSHKSAKLVQKVWSRSPFIRDLQLNSLENSKFLTIFT